MSENGYGFKMPGLKTGVKNDIFFGEPGVTPPPIYADSYSRVFAV